ncbi:hypothetical protein [Burkholderia sp. AU30198]|nr:hypothetical protein [Burkholderia sp. AU30198]
MSDDASAKAYWREVVIGLPPKDPWTLTVDMLAYRLDKTQPT